MSCECQTGQRVLLLHAPNLAAVYPELIEFHPGSAWDIDVELDSIRVRVRPGTLFETGASVVNFLRSILDETRVRGLSAAWLRQCPSGKGLTPVEPMRSLLSLLPGGSSPLMDLLVQRRIETWFQPVFHAVTGNVWGYECLMRGRAADGEYLSPVTILDWARQENLLFMLDRICRETHLNTAGAVGLPSDVRILINFMPTAIYDPQFCLRTTEAAARRSGIEPGRIIFEVVETDEVKDREHLVGILDHYRKGGYGFALDDVGAGYASLMMLADLDPDLIKIDRSLVCKAVDSPMHRSVCASLADIARQHGKIILAEGVETPAEKAVMDEIGVDLYQGFLFARPAPHLIEQMPVAEARVA